MQAGLPLAEPVLPHSNDQHQQEGRKLAGKDAFLRASDHKQHTQQGFKKSEIKGPELPPSPGQPGLLLVLPRIRRGDQRARWGYTQ
jgi:hypothetical protein